jgi:hypothetical protein
MDLWREAMKDAKNKLRLLFEASDENGNGVMEMDEFMQMIESLKTDVSEREVIPCTKHDVNKFLVRASVEFDCRY